MKKVLKILLIVVFVIVLFVVAAVFLLLKAANAPVVEENYYTSTDTGGALEERFTALGEYEVSYVEYKSSNKAAIKQEIWYPTEMENSKHTYPMVVMANGTGVVASKYKPVFKHLASWGFIVVGDEVQASALGNTSSEALDYMLSLNNDSNSIFYNKIDAGAIGIAGHSQGGFGAIRASLDYDNSNMFSSIFTASATTDSMLKSWNLAKDWGNYDTSRLTVPIFMVAGTGDTDANTISPLADMQKNFDKIPDTNFAVMARRNRLDHGAMLYSADGYMTAWFLYTLMDDKEAGRAFVGDNAEILQNTLWQDVKIKGNDITAISRGN